MQNIRIDQELTQKIPNLQLACIECSVEFEKKNTTLWQEIEQKITELNAQLKTEAISQLPAIAASRQAYKACGKDPARYRLSAEALLRRVVKQKNLYQISNIVDIVNLISISTGFSIGGYDADKIKGTITMGIGRASEAYRGIGRGELNIEFMPVFRDELGAFGSPTSDSERTAVNENTKRFLMIIIDFGSQELFSAAIQQAENLLKQFAHAKDFKIEIVKTDLPNNEAH